MTETFYDYQRRRFGILLAWGLGCVATGPLGLFTRDPFWRNFGLQAAGWGVVNAGIAFWGRRGASTKAAKEPDEATIHKDAKNLQRLLLINAGLDATYIAGGLWLTRQERRDRQGMGWGIVLQGMFLFFYDSLIGLEVGRRWLKQA